MSNSTLKSYASKVAGGVAGVTMLAMSAMSVGAQSVSIEQLLAQIAQLQDQLTSLQGGSTSGSTGVSYTFTRNLQVGSTGEDVRMLQKALNASADTRVASTGAGSPGAETTYFGPATKAAVIKFQNKYASEVLTPVGLSNGTGYFGPSSRAKMNAMSTGPGTGTGTIPTGSGLSVSAATQPMNALAIQGAARVPFTKFTVRAGASNVTMTGVMVMRTGPGVDGNFSGVTLLDENGQQIGIAKTLGSLHTATVGESVVIPAGTSRTFTIAGNMASSLTTNAGQVVALAVTGVNVDGGVTVTGVSETAPIVGAYHVINGTLTLGTATMNVSSLDPNNTNSKEIGTSNFVFAGVRMTAGSAEDVLLKSIRWNQAGSAGSGDLSNVRVVVDGTEYPTTISADGKYYTASFGSGIKIEKGLQKDVTIKADIVGGANRTVRFDIYKSTDVYVEGLTYMQGITPTAGSTSASSDSTAEFTTGTPFFHGALQNVTAGSVTTVSKATAGDGAAQNVAVNVTNQTLGGFEADIKGESVSVQSTIFWFQVSGSGGSITDIDNVSLFLKGVNGAADTIVAGPQDVASTGKVTFTDTVTFPTGKNTYILKGKLGTSFTNNQTVIASTTPSSDWSNVTGQITGNNITLSNGLVTFNTMTVKAATTTVTVSSSPSSQNVVMGQTAFTLANFQYDASASGEDIRVNSAQYTAETDTGASYPTNCFAYDGTTRLNSTAVNPTSDGAKTFTFDTALVVPKGTVKTVALKCDIPTNLTADDTFEWKLAASATNQATGTGSSQTITLTVADSTNNQNKMTFKSGGSFTVQLDSSSPSYSVKAANTTGNTSTVFKLRATNEAITLSQIALQLSNSSASSTPGNLTNVTLWDGATQVGTAVFTGSTRFATTTLSAPFVIPKDADKMLTVKVDLAPIGTSEAGTQGALVQVDYDGGDSTGTRGVGQASGSTINTGSTSDTATDGYRVFKSVPTVAADSLSATGVSDGRLMRFRVTADSKGDIGIAKFSFTIATTTASVTQLNLFGYTDSGYSNAISGVSAGGQIQSSNQASLASTGLNIYPKTSAGATTTIQVPAGQTRYFELRGSVSGVTTGASISTTLKGDASYPALSTLVGIAGPGAGTVDVTGSSVANFIWSGNATSSAAATDTDWSNSYGIPGLPSSGLIQTRGV
jgi:hypothetical protein